MDEEPCGLDAAQRFDHLGKRIALGKCQFAVQAADERVQRLTDALSEAVQGWRFETVVAALRALRGIDTVSAIGLIAEIGDIIRSATARQLVGYLGLVPSEYSSGNSIRRGSITKTGIAHAQRLLTEAAWNYRFPARLSTALRERSATLAARGRPSTTRIAVHRERQSMTLTCRRLIAELYFGETSMSAAVKCPVLAEIGIAELQSLCAGVAQI